MILKAKHNPFLYNFFSLYTRLRINMSFSKVIIRGDITDKGKPVLVIANHFSWWDGFWMMYMNMKLFRRKFYFMMLEEQLRKHMYFNKTGGYSVKRGSRTVIETIDYTVDLLKEKNNMVLIFPQGRIESNYRNNIVFEQGTVRIVSAVNSSVQIIFAVNLIEYYSHARPSVYICLSEYDGIGNPASIEEAYNRFLQSSVSVNIKTPEQ